MSREQFAPFLPGETYFGRNGMTPVDDFGGTDKPESSQWEGFEYEDNDTDFVNKVSRSQEVVRRRVVRNVSGGSLAAKDLVKFELGQHFGKRVDGFAVSDNPGYPIDEFLVNGCPDDDLCYIVVNGPATCRLPAAGAAQVAYGAAIRSAGSGRVKAHTAFTTPSDSTNTTALTNEILGRIGFSRSSLASSQNSADVVVNIRTWD